MTVPPVPTTVSFPLALLMSIGMAAGGAWIASEKTQAGLSVRMDRTDLQLGNIESQLRGYVPTPEFTLALADMKRELDDIRSDVKDIRHAVGTR